MKSAQCLADFLKKSRWQIFLFSIGSGYYRYREKSRQRPTRYCVFLQRRYLSSLGRYVFGSEISYNKAPPRLPGLGC